MEEGSKHEIEYEVYGLHHIRNGTYRLFGMPEGKKADIRRIPTLFDNPEEHDLATGVILLEMEKELKHQQENLLLMDAKADSKLPQPCRVKKLTYLSTYCNILSYTSLHDRTSPSAWYIPSRAGTVRGGITPPDWNSAQSASSCELLGRHRDRRGDSR